MLVDNSWRWLFFALPVRSCMYAALSCHGGVERPGAELFRSTSHTTTDAFYLYRCLFFSPATTFQRIRIHTKVKTFPLLVLVVLCSERVQRFLDSFRVLFGCVYNLPCPKNIPCFLEFFLSIGRTEEPATGGEWWYRGVNVFVRREVSRAGVEMKLFTD